MPPGSAVKLSESIGQDGETGDGGSPVLLNETMAILKAAMPFLREQYAVKNLAIFGSVVRNEAGPDSDVDLLVEFEPGRAGGYFKFFSLQQDLGARLIHRVNLVSPG
jgi:hypothetical protein